MLNDITDTTRSPGWSASRTDSRIYDVLEEIAGLLRDPRTAVNCYYIDTVRSVNDCAVRLDAITSNVRDNAIGADFGDTVYGQLGRLRDDLLTVAAVALATIVDVCDS